MSTTQKKSILVILTSADTATNGKPTGLYAPELAHPWLILKDDFDLTYVSPKGGKAPIDPASIEAFKDDEGCKKFFADAEIQKRINETGKLSDVKAADFDAVFYPGGHGPVVDLAFDDDSKKLIVDFYSSGKPVAAVCHAPAVFANVKLADGSPFIAGKRFAGFTNEEEEQAQGAALVPFLLETELVKQGGIHEKVDAWGVKVVVDSSDDGLKLLSGQNPASAGPLAEKLKELLA